MWRTLNRVVLQVTLDRFKTTNFYDKQYSRDDKVKKIIPKATTQQQKRQATEQYERRDKEVEENNSSQTKDTA